MSNTRVLRGGIGAAAAAAVAALVLLLMMVVAGAPGAARAADSEKAQVAIFNVPGMT